MHLLLLLACTDDPYVLDTSVTDTGVPECGRVRGTRAVLLYQDDGSTVRSPIETPTTADLATGVAGPVIDDRTYVAALGASTIRSYDGGCNWETGGTLPTGDWRLLGAGARVYAFDATAARGAWSEDAGLTWTPFDTVEPFIGLPVVDAGDPSRLRGLQSRGIVTSSDGGDTWSVGAALPAELATPAAGGLLSTNLDLAIIGGATGAWRSQNAGVSWTQVLTGDVRAAVFHPDDTAVLFAQETDDAGVATVLRSADSGATWARVVDSSQIELASAPSLWPVPGNPLQALSAFGPRYNENTASTGVNLYLITGGEGTRTTFVSGWTGIRQLAFGGDRWVAAADATAAR
jgi:hypothetical protein